MNLLARIKSPGENDLGAARESRERGLGMLSRCRQIGGIPMRQGRR